MYDNAVFDKIASLDWDDKKVRKNVVEAVILPAFCKAAICVNEKEIEIALSALAGWVENGDDDTLIYNKHKFENTAPEYPPHSGPYTRKRMQLFCAARDTMNAALGRKWANKDAQAAISNTLLAWSSKIERDYELDQIIEHVNTLTLPKATP